jgi:DNA-binding transcriptional ArsR family regulator
MAIPARNPKVRGAPSPKPLELTVTWGLVYESLVALSLFGGMESEMTYDVGAGWFKAVRGRASKELRDRGRKLLKAEPHCVLGLTGLVAETGGRDLAPFVRRLRDDRSGEVLRALRQQAHHGTLDRRDPREVAVETADLIELWDREIFSELGPPLEAELEASAEAILRLQRHLSPERLIVRATRGVEYRREPWINAVTLIPSILNRPWVDITEWDGVKYFFYPAGPDEPTPAAQLVEVYKALGDETRLRILRHLSRGPTSLTDLAEELGLAKSTVSQHMVVLRQAGLTRSLVGEERKGYVLAERPDLNDLLEGYLKG